MPHRLSLVRITANLRRSYTGETDSTVLPAVTHGIQTLSAEERVTLREILDHGYETRLLGENPFPTLNKRLLDAMLIDAADAVQQRLEAGILFALGQIAPYQWPKADVVAPMPVCRMVRPVRDVGETVLHLPASALVSMMTILVPRVVDGDALGLPGLRAVLHRRHVQLHLVDGGSSRAVLLSNTSFRQWAATLAFAEKMIGGGRVLAADSHVTAVERDMLGDGRTSGPTALASALLRRLRILGDTFWLTARPDGPDGIRLDWSGGNSAVQVAAALVHPLTGLAGDRFYVTRLVDGTVTIIVTKFSGEPTAKVTLCQVPLTAPPFTRIDTDAAWAAFNRAMAAPQSALDGLVLANTMTTDLPHAPSQGDAEPVIPSTPSENLPVSQFARTTARVADLRRAYTGEHNASVMPTTQRMLSTLSHYQLARLASVVACDTSSFGGRLLGQSSPTLDHEVLAAVLPDATTSAQRELETAVLLAIGRIHHYQKPDNALPHGELCRWVRADDSGLVLSLTVQALAVVLAELVPHEHGGQLFGLAGLRVRTSRRQVELYLADTTPEAAVVVSNISERQLAAAVAFSGITTGCPTLPDGPLSDLEVLAAASGRVPGLTALGSALLRRLGAFHDAERFAIDIVGSCVRIDWSGAPSAVSIAVLLTHPAAGLPDDSFTTTMALDGTITLTCVGLQANVALRRSVTATPRIASERTIADAWRAFDETAAAPPHLAAVSPAGAAIPTASGDTDG